MGFFNNLVQLELEGQLIEVEARSGIFAFEYSLIVDGRKQDQIRGLAGQFYLHGMLVTNDGEKPFKVKLVQHFGTFFTVEFDGQNHIPRKIY